jgi:hypothetical protein
MYPVRIVFYKKREPEDPRKTHEPGLKCGQKDTNEYYPEQKTFILEGKTYSKIPDQETNDNYRNANEVTDVACAIIKSNFNVSSLVANGTFIVHFHIPLHSER